MKKTIQIIREAAVLLLATLVVYSFYIGSLLAREDSKHFVLVIDAGHGGKDSGAVCNGVKEKDINLAVASLVKQKVNTSFPDVKVVMTRSTDTFIALNERARIANRNNADLFISIHTNSAKATSASGTETYVLGLWRTEDNLRVAMRENKVIELEENYKLTYQGFDPNSAESYIQFELMKDKNLDRSIDAARFIQNNLARLSLPNRDVRQAGFLVIREISMPGILVELGFVTNASDRSFLSSSEGQEKLAAAITKGFGQYYKRNGATGELPSKRQRVTTKEQAQDSSSTTEEKEISPQTKSNLPSAKASTPPKDQTEYRIQIASIPTSATKKSTNDSWFRGLDVKMTIEGRRYIYTVGSTTKLSEARGLLKKYQQWFKDAYIAVYRNNKRIDSIH